ncbi:branched-chain amino acid ABC transporter permease [Nocardioides sp. SYSU DS0651]|uniref:branched-chain amino acid ABC transporter permease n=1 Tax=Nocardioides sp. SYSU DS0651 TaxID=3415955 RepID=UPI003F4C9409
MRAVLTRWAQVPLLRHLGLGLASFLLLVVVLETASDFRVTQLTDVAYLAIAAGGLTVLTGVSGQLSLGHGAFMAVGAYTTAWFLAEPNSGPPLLVVLLAAVLVTVAFGALVGVAAARLHGPYVAGATLALAVAVPGIAQSFDALGGPQGQTIHLPETPPWLLDAAFFLTGNPLDSARFVAYLAWTSLIVTFIVLANLMRSRTGRLWAAVRDDDVAAELAGVHLGRARVLAFVVSTACAGLAGALLALRFGYAGPGSFGLTLSLTLVSVIVLGGLGSLSGVLIGAFVLTFLQRIVTDAGVGAGLDQTRAAEVAPVVYGLTLVLVVILAPAGLVGTVRDLRRRRRERALPADPVPSAVPAPQTHGHPTVSPEEEQP